MSGTATKATARQIRKALGPHALAAIDSHADTLTDLVRIASAHQATLDAWQAERDRAEKPTRPPALAGVRPMTGDYLGKEVARAIVNIFYLPQPWHIHVDFVPDTREYDVSIGGLTVRVPEGVSRENLLDGYILPQLLPNGF